MQETNQTVHPEVIREMEHERYVSPVEGALWMVTLSRTGLEDVGEAWPELLGTCVEEINGDSTSGILFPRFGLRYQLDIHEKIAVCSWVLHGQAGDGATDRGLQVSAGQSS